MRNRSTSPEHAEAVSRRLATLSAELAAVRGDPPRPMEHLHTRVRPDRLGLVEVDPQEAEVAADPPPLPTRIPSPGRHASRRLGDRVPLGPAHVVVLALVLAAALAVASWLVVRSSAEPAPLPAIEPAESPLLAAGETPAAAGPAGDAQGEVEGEAAREVTVDVAGRVRRPGIAVLPAGSRVVDAIEAAGGARGRVDLTSLNLARVLVDGEQVLVGIPAPTGAAAAAGDPAAGAAAGPLVNLNTADQTTLETLPGVGPVTATAIIGWRDEHGGFTAVDELLEVDGIGEATLEQISPHVTV
jgi:competence protein ComEA